MRGLVRSGASVALASLVLVGCSSGTAGQPAKTLPPKPSSSTDPTTSAPTTTHSSPQPTRSESAPPRPTLSDQAKMETAAGAERTVKYWLAALTYAMQSGDTKPFRAISSAHCKSCNNFAEAIEGYTSDGYAVSAHSPFRLVSVGVVSGPSRGAVTLRFDFVTGQIALRAHHTGKVLLGDPPETARTDATLTWSNGRWTVGAVELKA